MNTDTAALFSKKQFLMKITLGVALITGVATSSLAADLGEGSFKTSDGVRLHFVGGGSGQSIIFVPGWLMTNRIWASQMREFSSTHHVVSYDPRSQGRSEIAWGKDHSTARRAQDLHELVEELKLEPVVLVGWSMGVMEVVEYLNKYGTQGVSGVVLIDNSVDRSLSPPSMKGGFVRKLKEDYEPTVTNFVRWMFATPPPSEELHILTQSALRTPQSIAIELLQQGSTGEGLGVVLNESQVPVLYVGRSKYQAQALALKKLYPWVWTDIYKDAGHALFVDEEEKFNRRLNEFLESLEIKK